MGIIGLPVWFKQPEFFCSSNSNSTICSESEFCLHNDPANVSPHIQSLSYELELFCDRQYKKRMLLTWVFLGGLLGCLLNIAVYIKSERRKNVFAILGILYSFSYFGVFVFTDNELAVSICLMIMAFSIMIGNSYGFTVINEYLSGDLAKASTILLTLSRGLMGVFFAFFCFMINSSAKILFLTMGVMVFLTSIYLLNYKNEKGIKDVMRKAVNIKNMLKIYCKFLKFLARQRFRILQTNPPYERNQKQFHDLHLSLDNIFSDFE